MRVAGFGFRHAATVASLKDALARAGGGADRVATMADRATAAVFRAFAAEMGLPAEGVAGARLAAESTMTQSARVRERFGTGSVAEASALAAAGPGARLLGPRVISGDGLATAAIAERTDE